MELAVQSWKGLEEHTHDAVWVCTESRCFQLPNSPDGIEFQMKFEAKELRKQGVPKNRALTLRTSEYLVATDLYFVELVIRGQLIQNAAWDSFKEVYVKD